MVNYQHSGLFFTAEHMQPARKDRDREPFKSAWTLLLEQEQTEPLAAAHWNSLRYRLNDDLAAGEQAVTTLQSGLGLSEDEDSQSYFDALTASLTLAHCYELLRDHPAFPHTERAQWLNRFSVRVNRLNQVPYEIVYVEQLWLGALDVAAGIVLERDDLLETGAEIYRQTIRDEVRPEGYIPKAVESGDGQGLLRQLLSVAALVLMAEAASHVGLDLWGYTSRGVSVLTAAAYLKFYYYYPEKWKWDREIEPGPGLLFRQHGGFLEMLNRRTRSNDMKAMLIDLRPIYDPAGGVTTLTHGIAERKGLFG